MTDDAEFRVIHRGLWRPSYDKELFCHGRYTPYVTMTDDSCMAVRPRDTTNLIYTGIQTQSHCFNYDICLFPWSCWKSRNSIDNSIRGIEGASFDRSDRRATEGSQQLRKSTEIFRRAKKRRDHVTSASVTRSRCSIVNYPLTRKR